jgi:hypothetical protein
VGSSLLPSYAVLVPMHDGSRAAGATAVDALGGRLAPGRLAAGVVQGTCPGSGAAVLGAWESGRESLTGTPMVADY